jgi:hypothetical protein
MIRIRALRIAFAWAWLMLPLQGFAYAPACEQGAGASQSYQASHASPHHCAGESIVIRHHVCGDCCSLAVSLTSVPWISPRLTPPESSMTTLGSAPKGLLERLDRPPRFIPV